MPDKPFYTTPLKKKKNQQNSTNPNQQTSKKEKTTKNQETWTDCHLCGVHVHLWEKISLPIAQVIWGS